MAGRSNIVVVSGTDTEIGKTLVTCGLARRLGDEGIDVRAVKPVESGIDELEPGERDGVRLAEAARQEQPLRALRELGRPLAPPEAAEFAGVDLSMEGWCREIESLAAEAELVLVEGAGGILSPLTWDSTAREMAARLGAALLLVAPNELGVLTQTLTALESIERAGVPIAGVVYSDSSSSDESSDRNVRTLRKFGTIDRVARLRRVAGWREAAEELAEPAAWIREVFP